MRFTVVTSGSEGDTRPIAAVCRGLMDVGHEVCLFAEASSAEFPRSLGVPTEELHGDMKTTLNFGDPMVDVKLSDALATGKKVAAVAVGSAASRFKAVSHYARSSDAILFSGLALFVGRSVAGYFKKPAIGLWLQPITPTREFCSPMLPPMKLPGWLNVLTFKMLSAFLRRSLGARTEKAIEAALGEPLGTKLQFDFPILYGISNHLVRQPKDWPATHRLCGPWTAPTPQWQPPPDLTAFLAAGPAPIYVGFGSISGFIRKKRLLPLIDAIAGRRAIFFPGWSKIDASVLPANFFVAKETPHDWLFPQCSMVIHHGGAGTTHTAALSGVPSIVLPINGDQPYWASILADAGVAPRFKKGAQYDSNRIAAMIAFAEQADVRDRAKALAANMAQENGVATAVRAIEALVSKPS